MIWHSDPKKAHTNKKKHKTKKHVDISFEMAERVLEDPLSITIDDSYPHERRYNTIGRPDSNSGVTLVVCHTYNVEDQDADGRIISARRAKPSERRKYEEDNGES